MVFKRRTAAFGLVLVAAVGVGGCGSANSNGTPAADQSPSQPITSIAPPPTTTPSKAPTRVAVPEAKAKPALKPPPAPPAPQRSIRVAPTKSPSPIQPPRVLAGTISINNYSFVAPAYVSPGARITVLDKDNIAHSVTSDQGSFFNVIVQPGHSATFFAPRSPGRYAFHCIYHGEMHGILIVR